MWLPNSKYITAAQYLLPPPFTLSFTKSGFQPTPPWHLKIENFNGSKYKILSFSQSLRLSFMLKNSILPNFCNIFLFFKYMEAVYLMKYCFSIILTYLGVLSEQKKVIRINKFSGFRGRKIIFMS